jgi:acetyl esterase/lipase
MTMQKLQSSLPARAKPALRLLTKATATVGAFLTLIGCTPLGFVNGVVSQSQIKTTRNLAYGSLERQKLDVYAPQDLDGAKPVVLFVHGGYWRGGNKDDYPFLAEPLVNAGYVVVATNYRLSPTTVFPGFVEDVALATLWLRQNIGQYGGDNRKVFLMGHSAGAHIAALLLFDPSYLQNVGVGSDFFKGGLLLSGPYKLNPATDELTKQAMGPEANWNRVSPADLVAKINTPVLLQHGLNDTLVSIAQSKLLFDRIKAVNGPSELRLYDLDHPGMVAAYSKVVASISPRPLADALAFIKGLL